MWNRPRNCGRKTHSTRQRRGSQSSRESIRGTPGNHSAGHWNSGPSQLRSSSSWFAKARNSHCPGQEFVAETWRDNVVNYGCWDRADLRWQYADCAKLVDKSGKKGWQKLDGARARPGSPGVDLAGGGWGPTVVTSANAATLFPWVPDSGWPLPLAKPMGWQNGGKMAQKGGKMATFAGTCYVAIYDATSLLPYSSVNCRRKGCRETNSHNRLFINNLRRKHGFPNSRQAGKT